MLAATFVGCSKKKDETPKETQPEATEAPTEEVTDPIVEEEEEEENYLVPQSVKNLFCAHIGKRAVSAFCMQ